MDKEEARAVLEKHLEAYRLWPYEKLKAIEPSSVFVDGPSGKRYQIEVQAFPDDRSTGNIRVWGNIDDGGWSSFVPLTYCFIMAPDGSFVGE